MRRYPQFRATPTNVASLSSVGSAPAPASAALAAVGESGAVSASADATGANTVKRRKGGALVSVPAQICTLGAFGGAGSTAAAALAATGSSGTLNASAFTGATVYLSDTGGSGALSLSAFVQAMAAVAATGGSGALSAVAYVPALAALSATGGSGTIAASASITGQATAKLSTYTPTPPPADPTQVGQWAFAELMAIARLLADGLDCLQLRTLHAPPERPRDGMVVHADGTDWNPGTGAGHYSRTSGSWARMN